MVSYLMRYATPFITGLFLVSLISGVALFFHWGPTGFHGIHEWLSMVLIVPFVLHIWKNWRPMMAYFKRTPMAIALAVSVIACVPFLIPMGGGGESGGNPILGIVRLLNAAKPAHISAMAGRSEEEVIAMLKQAGFTAAVTDLPLSTIAQQSGKSDRDMITALSKMKAK
ncbi:DUF4405 domain-containing protein [Rhizobium sp. FKY42]|uniref:DUF4405 domain-containing protein n=1 Tax=Rhizobium sp. FKY42 TaxID=2562310 RepID=UPI0010C08741|nr:DUF4405 domain-containing protein [Rhizobium sp. FKY42]